MLSLSKRFQFIGLLAALAIIIGGFILSQNTKPAPKPIPVVKTAIKLGYSVGPVRALPVLIAKEQGMFTKYNLDVKSDALIGGIAATLTSGQFDVFNDGVATFLSAAVNGADIKFIGTTIQADPYYIISSTNKENIKNVVINRLGGDDYYQTVNTLRLMGVNLSSVNFVLSGTYEGKYPLLLRGSADTAGYPPIATYANVTKEFKKDGFSVIFNRTDSPSAYYPTGIVVRTDFLIKNGEGVKNLILALKEGMEYARSHKEDSVALIMKKYQLNKSDSEQLYGLFLNGTKTIDMKPNVEFVKTLLEDMSVEIKKASTYDATKFVDSSYTP